MTTALMKDLAGHAIGVHSAGTSPGDAVSERSAESLAEVRIGISGERPEPITAQLVRDVDVVVTRDLDGGRTARTGR
jgi:arsenate-mycothiol transferase